LQLIKAGGARANPTVFVIHHSFGDVNYDLDGFIVQNKHFYLQAAVLAAIESSAVSFIAHDSTQQGSDAGPPTAPPLPNGSTAKPNLLMTKAASLSNLLMTKSRDSLQKLLYTLTQHKLNYALCISTAPICKRVEKQAALFNKEHVVAQCRYYALSSRSIIIIIIAINIIVIFTIITINIIVITIAIIITIIITIVIVITIIITIIIYHYHHHTYHHHHHHHHHYYHSHHHHHHTYHHHYHHTYHYQGTTRCPAASPWGRRVTRTSSSTAGATTGTGRCCPFTSSLQTCPSACRARRNAWATP
jgi:amino acid transporter